MPKLYTVCTHDIAPIHDAILQEYRQDLIKADVRVGYRFVAKDGKNTAPALKLHGWPCYAIIRITSLEERQFGMPDAFCDIDQSKWVLMKERQRQGLIHHELEHLKVIFQGDDEVKFDGADRPVLKMKPHTVELGVFDTTIRIYGEDSIDLAHIKHAAEMVAQMKMPWG